MHLIAIPLVVVWYLLAGAWSVDSQGAGPITTKAHPFPDQDTCERIKPAMLAELIREIKEDGGDNTQAVAAGECRPLEFKLDPPKSAPAPRHVPGNHET